VSPSGIEAQALRVLDEPGLAQSLPESGGADGPSAGRLDGETRDAAGSDQGGECGGRGCQSTGIVVEHQGLAAAALEVQDRVSVVDHRERSGLAGRPMAGGLVGIDDVWPGESRPEGVGGIGGRKHESRIFDGLVVVALMGAQSIDRGR
jgi:hypothetical protein